MVHITDTIIQRKSAKNG